MILKFSVTALIVLARRLAMPIFSRGRALADRDRINDSSVDVYVGIDWADTKHDICLQAAGDDRREFDCIAHQVARIDEWAKSLHKHFGGPIAIALELAKGPIVYALQKYDFFVLFPINPSTLAKYRIAFKPSRAKDDPTDAEFALDLVLRHPEQFEPLQPQSAAMRALPARIWRHDCSQLSGSSAKRFQGADELQKYSGIAPVTERSGKKSWVHWRWQCPTFLRQTFVEWAGQTINKSFWAGAYYRQQRDKGSSHQAAVRALAFKWIRILYRCWITGTPYNESTYLNALRKRGSPLLKSIDPNPKTA